jgi:hypothetical protein
LLPTVVAGNRRRAEGSDMRPRLAVYALLTVLLAVAPNSWAQQRSGVLGPDDVTKELAGKAWVVKLPDGSPATEWFNTDGTVRITGGLMDEGRWRLWEKGYCTTWRRMRSGAERCFTLQRMPDGRIEIYKPNGNVSMTIVGFK